MLTAFLQFSVATHYCGGIAIGSIVSLTGKLADCSMETSEKGLPLSGTYFTNHCCDNVVIVCGVDNNYAPSYFYGSESFQYNFQVLAVPAALPANSFIGLKPLYPNVSPPDGLLSTDVDLSDICVFRI